MATYSITIPTKPYLKSYIQALYGKPVIFSQSNYFGLTVLAYLDRKFYFRQNEELVHKAFDKFDDHLEIFLPRWWMLQSHFGTDLPAQNIININKLFEEKFEEQLSQYCVLKDGKIKNRIEEFCNLHEILVGDDTTDHITFDALKKKEYRSRMKMQKRIGLS